MKALSISPKDRYVSAKEMKKAIEEYEKNREIEESKDSIPVKKIIEKKEDIKEDIDEYEVEIIESKPQPVSPLITAIPPSPRKVRKSKAIIFALLPVLLITGLFSLWKYYFNSPERFINMAKKELLKNHISETIKLCNKTLLLKSDNKEAHTLLLEAYLAGKDFTHAEEELEILIKLGGGTSENYLKWGNCFYSSDIYLPSARCFEYVLNEDPENLEILSKTAGCYESAGKKEEAVKKYITLGNIYLEKKDIQKAENSFNHIFKLDKNNIHAKEGLAGCYLKNKDYLESVKLLNSLPDNEKNRKEIKDILLECYLNLGKEYMDNENIDGSLKEYEKAFRVDKSNMEAKEGLARCYLLKARAFIKDGNIESAKNMCKNVKKLFTRGNFFIQLKDCLQEIAAIEKENHKVPSSPPSYNPPPYNPPPYNPPAGDGGGENPDVIGP